MRRHLLAVVLTLCGIATVPANSTFAQEDQSESARKVVKTVTPRYPSLATTMHLSGVVRVEAVVTENGTVKTVEIKGGHPVLAQAAASAVSQWKWAPASHESRESVQVKFIPQQ